MRVCESLSPTGSASVLKTARPKLVLSYFCLFIHPGLVWWYNIFTCMYKNPFECNITENLRPQHGVRKPLNSYKVCGGTSLCVSSKRKAKCQATLSLIELNTQQIIKICVVLRRNLKIILIIVLQMCATRAKDILLEYLLLSWTETEHMQHVSNNCTKINCT